MTSIALSLVAALATPQSDRDFLSAVSAVSQDVSPLVEFFAPMDDARIDARLLGKDAVANSNEWMVKILSPDALAGSEKIEWEGQNSKRKPSKNFVKNWTNAMGSFTWKDDGTLVALLIRPKQSQKVKTVKEAGAFIETTLKQCAMRPEENPPLEFFLKGAKAPFAGYVIRGKTIEAPNVEGLKARKFEGPLAWHNAYLAATDGERILIRFNFYGMSHEESWKVADPRNRW